MKIKANLGIGVYGDRNISINFLGYVWWLHTDEKGFRIDVFFWGKLRKVLERKNNPVLYYWNRESKPLRNITIHTRLNENDLYRKRIMQAV